MVSFSLRSLGSTTIGVPRLFVAIAGLGPLCLAFYRAPIWLETWSWGFVAGAIGAAAALLAAALGVAVRGSAGMVRRVAVEVVALGVALAAAEAVLLARSPSSWAEDPDVQQIAARERAARERGIEFDGRLRTDVVRGLNAQGRDALPGAAQIVGTNPVVAGAIRERGLLPLSNASNTLVVECNEGPGYVVYRSDELGFNNPPGVAFGPIDVAVIGESMALGHCVPPSKSAVDILRAEFPRTANFGVAGSRLLGQLGVFREYVEPLEPPVVVWFVNVSFAEPREEALQPILARYLSDASFSQNLRARQDEVDSFVREVMLPLNVERDEALRAELANANAFPLARLLKLSDVRGLVDFPRALRRPVEADMSHFARAIRLVVGTVRAWGGTVVVAVLPSYSLAMGRRGTVARYEGVLRALDGSGATVVDGAELFASQPDLRSLYTLGIANHPNERGHALLAEALIAAIEPHSEHEPARDHASR